MKINHRLAGRYKIEAVKMKEGVEVGRRVCADWFENLITDAGLNKLGTSGSYATYCQVGSGNAVPANANTALVSYLAHTSTIQTTNTGASGSAPYYVFLQRTYRFAEGEAAGNISEVGVGWATTGSLFSRALVLDYIGNPTTITILSDESLDVLYEVRNYIDIVDKTGTTVFTGNKGGSYDWIIRPGLVNTYSNISGWNASNAMSFTQSSGTKWPCGNGPIAAITSYPAGTSPLNLVPSAYVDSSMEISFTASATIALGNLSGGIREMHGALGQGYFQIQFDPPIPKTSIDVLTVVITLSWSRY